MAETTENSAAFPRSEAHPLLQKKTLPSSSTWKQWMERWEEAQSEEELISLLHWGFNVEFDRTRFTEEALERLFFYLAVGNHHDGYSWELLSPEESRMGCDELRKSRQSIAHKAFTILCQKFFNTDWKSYLNHDGVGENIILFFENGNMSSLEKDHNAELAAKFLKEFLQLAWRDWYVPNRSGFGERLKEEARTRLKTLRPRVIGLMAQHELLHIINDEFDSFTAKDLSHLKSLIFKTDSSLRSVNEALLGYGTPRYIANYFVIFERKFHARKEKLDLQRAKERVLDSQRQVRGLRKATRNSSKANH